MVGTNDIAKAKRFYDATTATLGGGWVRALSQRLFYRGKSGVTFAVTTPLDGATATVANGGTIGFTAASPAEVDAWHAAGLAHGGSDEGVPGVRENSPDRMYGAYLRDPDGNKLCAFAPCPDALPR